MSPEGKQIVKILIRGFKQIISSLERLLEGEAKQKG